MGIMYYGLKPYQKEALINYFNARSLMTPIARAELEDPIEYSEEAIQSAWFAFWLVLRKIIQDRPIFFWSGILAFVVVITHNMASWIIKLLG